jgi:hypothetical protein
MPLLNHSLNRKDIINVRIGGDVKAVNAEGLLNYGNKNDPQQLLPSYDLTKKELTRRNYDGTNPYARVNEWVTQTTPRKDVVNSSGEYQGSTMNQLIKKNLFKPFDENILPHTKYPLGGSTNLSNLDLYNVNPFINEATIYTGRFLLNKFKYNNLNQLIVEKNAKVKNDDSNHGSKLSSLMQRGLI